MRDFTGVSGASGGSADSDTRWTETVANSWKNELCNVVTNVLGGNVALNPADDTQLLTAIRTIVANALASLAYGITVTANGYGIALSIPTDDGTYHLQFGSVFVANQSSTTVTFPVAFTTSSVFLASGGPNSNDDSDAHSAGASLSGGTVRNSDGSSTTAFWIAAGK
ncbi:MAG: hypothetical protein ABIO86_17220 [Sphingomonas sp.]